MKAIQNLWNKYKALSWWKKVLLFLPLLIVIVLICLLLFWKPSNDGDRFESAVKYGKKQVDKRIAEREAQDKLLKKQDDALAKKQKQLEKEIKANEKEASKLIDRVDSAAANGDADELRSIISELNAASKNH